MQSTRTTSTSMSKWRSILRCRRRAMKCLAVLWSSWNVTPRSSRHTLSMITRCGLFRLAVSSHMIVFKSVLFVVVTYCVLQSLGRVRAPEILEQTQQPRDGARGLLCARNCSQTGQYALIQNAVRHEYILLPQTWHGAFGWYVFRKQVLFYPCFVSFVFWNKSRRKRKKKQTNWEIHF